MKILAAHSRDFSRELAASLRFQAGILGYSIAGMKAFEYYCKRDSSGVSFFL